MSATAFPAPGDVLIQVRQLVVRYGQRTVLDGLDLDVRAGEILVIMGGSGSGKSTFLRHLLALETPSSGELRLFGEDLRRLNARRMHAMRRHMGVSFQSGALMSSLSVGDNILLPLREHGRLPESLMRIMMRIKLDMVRLPGCEALLPAELSGGMTKRVALARALILDPPLVFLDEPSAGLDPVVAVEIDEMLIQLRDALGMSFVVVTHELESAMKIADRICVLDRGRIIALGSVEEVRSSSNERVQALLTRQVEDNRPAPHDYFEQLTGRRNTLRVN